MEQGAKIITKIEGMVKTREYGYVFLAWIKGKRLVKNRPCFTRKIYIKRYVEGC